MYSDKDIIDLYQKCGNGATIAKHFNINMYRVYKILRRNGIKIKPRGGKEKYPLSILIELYQSGHSITEIATKVGADSSTIYERLIKHIKLRNKSESARRKIPINQYQDIKKLYEEGLSSKKIAEIYGVHKSSIILILKNLGVEIKKNAGPNNHLWKGGITPLHSRIRNCKKYSDLRNRLFENANYTCQITGESSCILNIHHKHKFSDILQEFIILHPDKSMDELYELSLNYEPFWDESNILVVSEKEHKRIHNAIGSSIDVHALSSFLSNKNIEFTSNDDGSINLSKLDILLVTNNDKNLIKFLVKNKRKFFVLSKNFLQEIDAIISFPNTLESLSYREIPNNLMKSFVLNYHYLHKRPACTIASIGLFYRSILVGICSFGRGANQHIAKEGIELTRLALLGWLPKNTASFFIKRAIKILKNKKPETKKIIAYCDPNVGHIGTVYKASNWKLQAVCRKDYMYLLPSGEVVHKSYFRRIKGIDKTEKQLSKEAYAERVPIYGKLKYSLIV